MNTIKNINKLYDTINTESIAKLEAGAGLHSRYSNITFKILEVNDREIHVRAEQNKSQAENYATTSELITRTRELFNQFVPDKTVYTHPVPYQPSPVEIVTTAWINDQMFDKGIKVKQISADTGIDKTNISAWLNDIRPMSQIVKALFYYYFLQKPELSIKPIRVFGGAMNVFKRDLDKIKAGDTISFDTSSEFSNVGLRNLLMEKARALNCTVEQDNSKTPIVSYYFKANE